MTPEPLEQLRRTLGPLVTLLRQELRLAGLASPRHVPANLDEFAHWYLEAVQLLELHVAGDEDHAPMTRGEVELMCRTALSGATLREAIDLVCRFCAALHPRAGRPALVERTGIAHFELDPLRGRNTSASSLVDITGMFAFQQLFQWLVGGESRLRVLQVRIGPLQRADLLPFLKLFKAPVLAGGTGYALEFAAKELERPVVRSRQEFPAFFEVFPCGILESGRGGLAQQVAALLSAAALHGDGPPALAELAGTLELAPSTLRRQLAQAGTSYRALRSACLAELAQVWLARGDLGVEQVATRLGFSDAAAFRRASRQWTGHSPTTWRRARGG